MMRQFLADRIYYTLTATIRVIVRLLVRLEVVGTERVPAEGPVVLICNHSHIVDPPLLGSFSPRYVHTMAKRELFETPLIGWIFWAVGAFPVRRFSGDLGALRVARNYLRDGGVVLMYPEGTRNHGNGLIPALPGAAMVAILANAPVVPVAIEGSHAIRWKSIAFLWLLRRRPSIRIEFGEPFELERSKANAQSAMEATDIVMRKVAALLSPRYRGAYGEQSEGTIVVARATPDRREQFEAERRSNRE
jgi:1-acyl-sn-glycerol-3-phosphate acyltransferase